MSDDPREKLFERPDWTPPILGYQYRMEWTRRSPSINPPGKGVTTNCIWVGYSIDDGPLKVFCSMNPKFKVMWTVQLSVAGAHVSMSRSSYDLDEVIADVENRVRQCIRELKGLMG